MTKAKPAASATSATKPARATTVDAYISQVEPSRRAEFVALLDLVGASTPGATETILYGMPSFSVGEYGVCAVAAQKRYFALYVCERDLLEVHLDALAKLDVGQGCIRFRRLDLLPAKTTKKLLASVLKRARAGKTEKIVGGRG